MLEPLFVSFLVVFHFLFLSPLSLSLSIFFHVISLTLQSYRLEQLVAIHRQLLRKFAMLELENGESKKKIQVRERESWGYYRGDVIKHQ